MTYREFNDDFLLLLLFGESAVALMKEIRKHAFGPHANDPVSDFYAAEINRVAGLNVMARKPLKPLKVQIRGRRQALT